MKPTITKIMSAAGIISTLLAPIIAKAQTVAVPFSFRVGGVVYPAGSYSVERPARGLFVWMTDTKGKEILHRVLVAGEADLNRSGVTLRFDESGQSHLLRSIQYDSLATSRLDGKSFLEETSPQVK